MAKNYGLGSFNIHKSGKILLKINLELQWPLWGTFPLDKIVHLRSALESQGSQIKQTEWHTYFNWYAEAFKRLLQDSKVASLKNLLQKANEKLKANKT